MRKLLGILGCCLILAGCGSLVSPAELEDMRRMNAGWRSDIEPLREVLATAGAEHQELFARLGDTALAGARAMQRDTLGMLRLNQAEARYVRWYSGAVSQVKRLEGMVAENAAWFRRLPDTHLPLARVRRSWDARRTAFYQTYEQCKVLVAGYEGHAGESGGYGGRLE